MRIARRTAAARNAFAILIAVGISPATTFAAGGEPQLLLPLVAAITLGASAVSGANEMAHDASGGLSIIPPRMHIPDLYAIEYDRDPARFAEPIDNDRLVSLDLLPGRRWGWMPSLAYDNESPQVLGPSSTVIRLTVEYNF